MTLDNECIRTVMLELESFEIGVYSVSDFKISINKYSFDKTAYTLLKLLEAGFINATSIRTQDGAPHISNIFDLTFSGHEFLSTIKDDENWNKIKKGASVLKNFSLEALKAVASGITGTAIKSFMSNS